MVIMAIDHCRDFLHVTALSQDPTNLSTTTPALFFTRWITHLCAPIFVFLAGMSGFFALKNTVDQTAARRLLRRRGLWLMFLEMTVVNFALWFDPGFHTIMFQVIFAIGFGLFLLSFLSRLSANALGAVGLLLIFGHCLVPVASQDSGLVQQFFQTLLFRFAVFPAGEGYMVMILYPLMPWFGILLFGYACGQVYQKTSSERQNLLLQLGGGSLLVFLALRTWNIYGDPNPWGPQRDALFSLMSFINVSKYPPSLLFAALTLGIGLLLLAVFGEMDNRVSRFLKVYGQVPMFYYIIHWYIIHFIMVGMLYASGLKPTVGPLDFGRPAQNWGLSLPAVYMVWAALVLALYPLCKWFGEYKHTHSKEKWWLRYI